ncbi:MAG: nucleoside phosphorylase [Oscillospiraceae bacterium]|jgi:uridine phosphorylase|nr:nucleoside phosphorylase [Oscillospiraceae bacterium]
MDTHGSTIIDSFDSDREAIISASHMNEAIEGFPEVAVVTFASQNIAVAREQLGAVHISDMHQNAGLHIYGVDHKGKKIALYYTGVGGPAAAGYMEDVIAKGARKFVFYGACGVLNHAIVEKSLVVPTEAYRDEGTSYHYAPPSAYIKVKTADRLASILEELNIPHVCGRTWTTDAIYRETRGNMKKRRDDGCLTVEMECASIMAAAQFRGVDCYQFLYAADSLDAVEWDSRTLGKLTDDHRASFLRIAFEVASRV